VVRVGGRAFGIPLTAVVEVIRMVALAAPPEGSPGLTGVLDLRGSAVPVVDVADRLGLTPQAAVLDRRIVVTADPGGRVGLVVDGVDGIGPPGPPALDVALGRRPATDG
jgi:purine-binding chemotaxis protein CheW